MNESKGKIHNAYENNYYGNGHQREVNFGNGESYKIRNSHLHNYFGDGYQQEIVPSSGSSYDSGGDLIKVILLLINIPFFVGFFLLGEHFILGLTMMVLDLVCDVLVFTKGITGSFKMSLYQIIVALIFMVLILIVPLAPFIVGFFGGYI